VTEQRVRIDVDLGVEREQGCLPRHDQRVDLDEAQVLLDVEAIERRGERLELSDDRALELETEGEVAHLIPLQSRRRVDVDAQNLLGGRGRDLLDLHASGLGGHDDVGRAGAVERDREVELALDGRRLLDEYRAHQDALGRSLGRLELHAENLARGAFGPVRVIGHLDAPGLAAPSGVVATSPAGTGTPNSRKSALAWYSWIFTGARSGLSALLAPELL
jgi:hypothetical protein